MTCPFPIATYSSPDAPAGYEHIALVIFEGGTGPKGERGANSTMLFRASSAEAARVKAEAFIAAEIDKERARDANRQAQSERMKARRGVTQ